MEEGADELEEVQGLVQAASAQGLTLTAEWIQAKTAIIDTVSVVLLSNKAFNSVSDMPVTTVLMSANPSSNKGANTVIQSSCNRWAYNSQCQSFW